MLGEFERWAEDERCVEGDPLFDYCLWPYKPLKDPFGQCSSLNLLLNSFSELKLPVSSMNLIDAIRMAMGGNKTVWGVKQVDGVLSWEFYFYDYERLERTNSFTKLKAALAPYIDCDLNCNENSPYFMFSIDLNVEALCSPNACLSEINVYMGNDGSNVSSGICYSLSEAGLRLDNLYYFYDKTKNMSEIVAKIACSAHIDLKLLDIKQVLLPELVDCQTIVVANKKMNDGVYFSRITIEQLLWFLQEMAYPESIVEYISLQQERLGHMLYDVGMDYRMLPDGNIEVMKTSYYGVF